MRFRTIFALLLITLAAKPPGAIAQPSPSPATQPGTADAIRVLLEQADYWRGKYQAQLSDEALTRVLALDPRNADALALQAQSAADRNDLKSAQVSLAKLQSVRPDDPRIATVQQALQAGPLDPDILMEARREAAAGQAARAVAAYRRAFKGDDPPPSLAVEYYQQLASVDGNWDAARDGLAAHIRADPQDLRAQLAYAQAMTYHEGTRADGVDRLAALSALPSVGPTARASWRNALLWSTDDDRAQAQIDAYLQQNPTDPAIEAKKTEIKASLPDAGVHSRLEGYASLEDHKLADAEKQFTAALASNPNDVEAMSMLAVIRRFQGRWAEASALIAKIEELAPDRRNELITEQNLDKPYGPAGGVGRSDPGDAGRAIRRRYEEVTALTRRGEFDAAETLLRRLTGPRPNAGSVLQLADIQARAGRLKQAEASFRTVLRSQPGSAAALAGLATVLTRDGKSGEADALFARAEATGHGSSIGASHAQALRQEALAASDPATRAGLFRQAVAADPANPWLRLELARLLLSQRQADEARSVMAPVADATKPGVDQLRAAIYFAEADGDDRLGAVLAARLPPNALTPDMRDVEARAALATDLRDARSQAGLPAVRRRLLALAAKPDPTGARGAAFAQELVRLGDKAGAREVIRTAYNVRPPQPQQRIAYAGALVGAGYPRDAELISGSLQPERLDPAQRTELTQVRNGAAVVAADVLTGRGQAADAYDQLAPRLAKEPENPELNLALARLYAAQKQPRKADLIIEDMRRRNPDSPSVQVAAIYAAMQDGDIGRAADLAGQAKKESAAEPQVWVAAAQVARAQGKYRQALEELRTARDLRRKQLAASSSSDASDVIRARWPFHTPASALLSDRPGLA